MILFFLFFLQKYSGTSTLPHLQETLERQPLYVRVGYFQVEQSKLDLHLCPDKQETYDFLYFISYFL